jgi:hypothetical protein
MKLKTGILHMLLFFTICFAYKFTFSQAILNTAHMIYSFYKTLSLHILTLTE